MTGRGIILVQNLIESSGVKSLKLLAEELNLTERAVRYELEKVIEYLKDSENRDAIELKKGMVIVKNIQNLNETLKKDYSIKYLIPEEREKFIELELIFKRMINLANLSQEFDISRNTVKGYLRNIEIELKKYGLSLEISHKKGLILKGNEENIRIYALSVISKLKSNKNPFFIDIMERYLPKKNGIESFLNYSQKRMNRIISDEAYEIIKKYLRITIAMVKNGHTILEIKNERFLEKTDEFSAVMKASALLEADYDVELSKYEYLKITDYFLGSHTYNFRYSYYENWVQMEVLIKKLIYNFNRYIDVDISNDELLLDGLLNHLKPTIYRVQNGIELENSIYIEVLESYPTLFKTTKKVIKSIEDYVGREFSSDEIAFITIHFKSAIDRNRTIIKEKKKLLVVCDLGYGASKLLAQQLRDIFAVEVVDILPKHILKNNYERNEVDLIVTTVDLKKEEFNIPVVKVRPLLNAEDITKLKRFNLKEKKGRYLLSEIYGEIEKSCEIKDKNSLIKSLKQLLGTRLIDDFLSKKITIFDTISKSFISLNQKAENWEEAIKIAGSILLKNNCIEKSYIENMIECVRNYGSYMVVDENIAFPHAKSEGDVKKTAFAIVTLENEVLFPENVPIKTIIAFSSVDNKEHLDMFLELMEMIEKKEFKVENFVKKF